MDESGQIPYWEDLPNPPERVRAGQVFVFRRSGWDVAMREHCPDVKEGQFVRVVQLPSSPKPGTMGQVHIEDAYTGEFLGMCSMKSLSTRKDELGEKKFQPSGDEEPLMRKNPPSHTRGKDIQIGSMVQYAREFLVSTGTYTGDIPFAVGKVLRIDGPIATIDWDRPDVPNRVNVFNLVRKDRVHLESNPPLNAAEDTKNRRLVGFLMRLPNVKAAEAGRMGTGEFFYEVEDTKGKIFRHKYDTQDELIDGVKMFVKGIERDNPPLEILSDKLDGKVRVVHYRVTIQMKGPKDAEAILHTLYPAWKIVSHYSLRSGAYPNVAHAYGVQMKLKSGKNPPDDAFMYQHIVAAYGHVLPVAAPGEWLSASEFATYLRRNYDLKEPRNMAAYEFLEANTSLHFHKERGGKIRVKRIHDNPPLPASALMDISTAKTVAREVEEGARQLGSLGTVEHLLDRGLQKLRGSHLGQVDWQNPGPGKIPRHGKRMQPLSRHNVVKAIEQLVESNVEVGELLGKLKRRGIVSDGEYLEWQYVQQIALMLLDDLSLATGSEMTNPPTATEIYRDIVEIKAIKPDGKRYVHKFGKGSNIYGLPNGNILIQSRKGKRLWKNFKMEG